MLQKDHQGLFEVKCFKFDIFKAQLDTGVALEERNESQNCGKRLSDNGRQSNSRSAHIELENKEKVEKSIGDGGNYHGHQRCLAVTYGPQSTGTEVKEADSGKRAHIVDHK